MNSFEKTDTSIVSYPMTSEKECKRKFIAEWGDVKSEPFVCLVPKSFSQHDRLENEKCTFNSSMCDQIFDLLPKNNYIRILDHYVKPSIQGRMYCKLHDLFEHNIENYNMFHQIVKSAIDKERLKLVETRRDDQSIPIGHDGKKCLHRLLQADPFKDDKVKTPGDGIKLSSKEIVQVCNEDIFKGGNSIKATMKTPSIGGSKKIQRLIHANPKNKGQNKHQGKKSNITFTELLDKY